MRRGDGMGNGEPHISDAHEFIKRKLKEIKKTQIMLAHEVADDRVTYYRRLKNELPMSESYKAALYGALHLTPYEIEEFSRMLRVVQFGEEAVSLWKKMDSVLFGLSSPKIPNFYVQTYEGAGKRYNAGIFFEQMFSVSENPDFSYELNIMNCVSPWASRKLAKLLEIVVPLKRDGTVNHLVDFSDNGDMNNFDAITALIFQLPLIQIKNYSVFYRQVKGSPKESIFENSVLCSLSYGTGPKVRDNYWLVFSENGDSNCVTITDEAYAFIKHHYDIFGECFQSLLFQSHSDELFMRELYDIQKAENEAVMMLKSDPGYDLIPPDVYDSWKNRVLPVIDADGILYFANAMPHLNLENAIDYFINFQKLRYELTKTKKRVDVQSVNGLTAFAKTGRLSNHIGGVPPLSGTETARILQNLRARSRDQNDPYWLYITRSELLNGKYFICASKSGAVFIELLFTRAEQFFKNVSLKNPGLSWLFFRYLDNWLIPTYTMTPADSDKFLLRLIEEARRRGE